MYLLNDTKNIHKIDKRAAYTKNQLHVVSENEEAPLPKVIRGNPKTYVISKILDKRKRKNKIEYKIRWKGYGPEDDTWEPRKKLIEDVPLLVDEFEKTRKSDLKK
jgi:hypothetical protein